MTNELYTKFKLDVKRRRCWILNNRGNEIEEITNVWNDKYGSMGFTIWTAPDWAKSGRTTWLNFHVREGANWNQKSVQGGRQLKEPILEVFYKYYSPQNEEFKYWKRYYNLGPDFWENETKGMVIVEFVEEYRVEKNRQIGKWVYINKGNKFAILETDKANKEGK